MADLVLPSGSATIKDLIQRIGWYKGSPVRTAMATYQFFDDVMQNKVNLVDGLNPFTLLLESSCVHGSLAVNESLINLRKGYSGLAQTDDDVYRHMTDAEFVDRFAFPGAVNFNFFIELTSLLAAMVEDPTENCLKAIIPRDTTISVDIYTFTFEYPIVIRQFPNGMIQVTYDLSIASPISKPSSPVIQFVTRQYLGGSGVTKWLNFSVPVKQMKVQSINQALQREAIFSKNLGFTDEFLFARVFQKSSTTGADWVEMKTTHSDQVFDPATPTAVLKVTTNNLNVTIPYIYNTSGLVAGTIRIDLYTTKGSITVDLSGYKQNQWTTSLTIIDKIRDSNAFTGIWGTVTYFSYSSDVLSGGTDSVPFTTLKQKVVNYAFGDANVPITNAQLAEIGLQYGFTVVPNADALTERYFLGIQQLPEAFVTVVDTSTNTNTQKLLSRANLGMIRLSAAVADLQASDNVMANDTRLTLLSNTMFTLNNGIASLVDSSTVAALKLQAVSSLVAAVNAASYVYTPFYYVFDIGGQSLGVRPYDLDHPDAVNLDFVAQNQSLMMPVNTGQYSIEKIATGYRVTIITNSTAYYKAPITPDNQVAVQMRLTNTDGSVSATINGVLKGTVPTGQTGAGERIFTFDIQTTYDVDTTNSIQVINAFTNDGTQTTSGFYIPLNAVVDLIYTTNSVTVGFVPDATNTLINASKLPIGSVGNSHDRLTVTMGVYLDHLWDRIRVYATGTDYQTAPADIPLYYTEDIYAKDPTSGYMLVGLDGSRNVQYTKLHSAGDLVLSEICDQISSTNVPLTGNVPLVINTVTIDAGDVVGLIGQTLFSQNGSYTYADNGHTYTLTFHLGPVFKYRAGQTLLDNMGNPVPVNGVTAKNDIDIMVVDGNLAFATDPNYVTYRDEVVSTITGWITNDIINVQARLMERSKIFFYPQASLGLTQITLTNGQNVYIESEQTPNVDVYIDKSVYGNKQVQDNMTDQIGNYLDTAVAQLSFTVQKLEEDMAALLGSNVKGVTMSGLGGSANYKAMDVTDQHNRLCIQRQLVVNTDGTITVQPAININFIPL
jgi:hypothetical protein